MGMALAVPSYTIEDLDSFPDDGNRYELLEGVLLVTPSPSLRHQLVATRLAAALTSGLETGDRARVVAPGVVIRPPRTQLEPDILVYPAHLRARRRWIDLTEHWLAVEVYSPSSRIYDRDYKRSAYLQLGVREVWLVDIDEESVEMSHRDAPPQVVRSVLEWSVPDSGSPVRIELREIFRD